VTLRSPDGTWVSGHYTFRIEVPGAVNSCEATLPDDLPAAFGMVTGPSCSPTAPLAGGLQYWADGKGARSADGLSGTFTPTPGHWHLLATLPGTPSTVDILVERDGQKLLEARRRLEYETFYPNGPDCDVTGCKGASVDLVVPSTP
jgi:hypothetical protein